VRWFLGINGDALPREIREKGQSTYRSLKMEGKEIEFSDGFKDLHTKSYEMILDGEGFRLKEALPSINLVHQIRIADAIGTKGDYHPFARLPLSVHPFNA
jgi:UDP-N-acetyl-2-amino-2-deoxyglucuronate dehydrogenase